MSADGVLVSLGRQLGSGLSICSSHSLVSYLEYVDPLLVCLMSIVRKWLGSKLGFQVDRNELASGETQQ